MGCSIDECRDRYDALSPVEYVSHSHGPVLFLNGDQDQRCPVGQTEQLFTRLMKLGCAPSSMVIYPGGGHALAATGRPTHREDYHGRIMDFLLNLW
jgi:dipeptidyl aminopeptidase/acylaminoacyl peptidase